MKTRGRTYYHNNRERQLLLANKRRKYALLLKRKFINELKSKACLDCGKSYPPYVMDFDHKKGYGKIENIARMAGGNWSFLKIKKEIKKCDIVCANCHRIRTYKEKYAGIAKVVTAGL